MDKAHTYQPQALSGPRFFYSPFSPEQLELKCPVRRDGLLGIVAAELSGEGSCGAESSAWGVGSAPSLFKAAQ